MSTSTAVVRLTLLGVGAMNSPRYRPAGLLVGWHGRRVMLDGGGDTDAGGASTGGVGADADRPGAARPRAPISAWLVTDDRAELIRDIRRLAQRLGTAPEVGSWQAAGMRIRPLPVVHTAHPTYGYLIDVGGRRIVWAPEFWEFPGWAAQADLMFADAAGWQRPIRFAGGVGGHASVVETAAQAQAHGVRRLVFAHIGRPCIRAQDAGHLPPYGEWGADGRRYRLSVHAEPSAGPLTAGHLPVDVLPSPSEGDIWGFGRS